MQGSVFARYVAGFATAVLLSGCSGGGKAVPSTMGSAGTATIATPLNAATLVAPPNVRPVLRRAPVDVPMIQPNCCARKKTLFVSDAFGGSSFTGTVYAFDYKTAKLLGQLPAPPEGWLEVQGACADNSGNVYFANTSLSTVEEYTHAGMYVATIDDPGQYPVMCAYDRTTGNLAVSNIISTSGGPGSISLYHGGLLQHTYYPSNMSRVYFVGYEGTSGVLWLDGESSSGIALIDTFFNGKFKRLKISGLGGGLIQIGGGLQWSAQTRVMNVGGSDASGNVVLYWVSSSGKIVGSTIIDCSSCGVFFIKGPRVAFTDLETLNVLLFDYPQGGAPVAQYSANFNQPIGIVVSP